MTDQEKALWIQVYAAVMSGMCSNPDVRHNWAELRDRAKTEANLAIRAMREASYKMRDI